MADIAAEIAAKLGLQTGEFKAALADANASVKSFGESSTHDVGALTEAVHETHRAFRLFHQFIVGGGIVEAVKQFYEMAIQYAEKHKDASVEELEAVEHIKTALEQAKDNVGKAAFEVTAFVDHAVTGLEYIAAGILSAFKGEGFAAGIKNFQDIESAEGNINRLLEKTKQTKEQIAKIDEQIEAAEKRKSDAEFNALDATQRLALVTQKLKDETDILNNTIAGSLAHEQARLAVLNLESIKKKAEGEIEKDNAKQEAEDDKASQAALDEEWATFVAYMKDKNQEERDNLAAKKKGLEEVIAQTQKETEESLAVAQAWDDGTKNVYTMIEGVTKLNEQTKSFVDMWEGFQGTIKNTGDVRSLSDTQIQALIHKLNDEISKQQAQSMTNPFYDPLYDPVLQSYKMNLAAAQKEVSARSDFNFTLRGFGQQYAEASYDPSEYQRLSGLLGGTDKLSQISNGIQNINKTLTNVFLGG